ncbi:MAG: hypothetical protein ABJB16_05280 [Saprospiraceae bacterium]
MKTHNQTLLQSLFVMMAFLMTIHSQAQIGRVGINTTTPQAMLQVKDSSVVFTGAMTIPLTPGDPPVSGLGVRMMWYPNKAAFRAGAVNSTQWDQSNIGDISFATGFNTKAYGDYSTAMGASSIASGYNSTALGGGPIASGYNSTALGENSTASGSASTAMGFHTSATGAYSTAMGNYTTASGGNSTAIGDFTTASGNASTAMGYVTLSKPYASLVIGRYNDTTSISSTSWNPSDAVFIIGNGSADNIRSNAMTVIKNGNTGIGTISPQRLLHVSGGAGGELYQNEAEMIIEDNSSTYLQFSSPTLSPSGIYSGNAVTSTRSALIFNPDSSVVLRSGGNTNRLIINKAGNIGIGTDLKKNFM